MAITSLYDKYSYKEDICRFFGAFLFVSLPKPIIPLILKGYLYEKDLNILSIISKIPTAHQEAKLFSSQLQIPNSQVATTPTLTSCVFSCQLVWGPRTPKKHTFVLNF
jgi:hypothetical protein